MNECAGLITKAMDKIKGDTDFVALTSISVASASRTARSQSTGSAMSGSLRTAMESLPLPPPLSPLPSATLSTKALPALASEIPISRPWVDAEVQPRSSAGRGVAVPSSSSLARR